METDSKLNRHRVAIYQSHPTQMEAPLFRKMAQEFSLKVYFWRTSTITQLIDPELGHPPGWDFLLVDGYEHEVIPANGFFHRYLRRTAPFMTDEFDAIVINGYGFRESLIALFTARSKGLPVIVRSDTTMLYERSPWKEKVREPLLHILLGQISAFLATGSRAKEYLMHYGVPEHKIFRFPYAIDNDRFSQESERCRSIRTEFRIGIGVPPEATVFLAVIKLIEREGCFHLIEGFSRIAQSDPKAWLVIVGDGPEKSKLQRQVFSMKIPRIVFAGYQQYSALPKFYAAADVFIHPALVEPWGVSVNEAMACGLPVIVSDKVGSGYDLVQHGWNGFVYQAGDPVSLANVLTQFLRKFAERKLMGERSRQIVQDWGFNACTSELGTALTYIKSETT
jgi:glycosyltransferase involved in cell wall biosynthesis